MMASIVLAIAVVGVAASVTASYKQADDSQETAVALSLGRQLLEEIAAKPYADPTDGTMTLGPESGETSRALFDNLDDYHNYTDRANSGTSTLTTLDGSSLSVGGGTQVYVRTVTVEYRTTPSGSSAASGDFARVLVRVTTPTKGDKISLSRLVTRITWTQ
jgi:hypothetical protein